MARFRPSRLLRRKRPRIAGARIVVGLGNPGAAYRENRHNAGARTIDVLSRMLDLPLQRRDKAALTGEAPTAHGPLVLAKPRLFMNHSGRAVQALLTQYRAQPSDLILIVDELDLPVGKVRVRPGGGDAGQQGMRSIKQTLGALEFPRVRIGVGRPTVDDVPSHDPEVVGDHLLSDPSPEEAERLRRAERTAAEAVIAILHGGVGAAMNDFNG